MALHRKRGPVLNNARLLAAFVQYQRPMLFTLIALALIPTSGLQAAKADLASPPVLTSGADYLLWVDGVTYTTMAACYAAIPSTGGVCMVPPNYSETLAASIICNKSYSGFVFTGPASIVAGSNQFIVPAGTRSCFIDSW